MKELVQLYQAEAVIFDQALSPAQQRNLERTWASRSPTARC